MGVTVTGLDELIGDLEALDERLAAAAPKVVSKGALHIKTAWRRRWTPISPDPATHAPHLARGVGYDTARRGTSFSAEIGVSPLNPQAALAHFAEYGSLKNRPYPGGLPSLLEEAPRFAQAAADMAVDLLEGR